MRLVCTCLFAVFASFSLFGARPAGAMCIPPATGFSPPDGTVLPASAAVYLFVVKPSYEAAAPPIQLTLEVTGARFATHRIATTPRYDVVRIDLAASSQEVMIRWKPDERYTTEVRYPVGPPAPSAALVTGVTHTRFAWSCSHTDTIDVALTGNAIAYRLDWSDGTSAVIPPSFRALRNRGGREELAAPSHVLAIGHLSCVGDTVEPQALATLREVRLTALFVDGSEYRFAPARAQLDRDVIRLPRELLRAESVGSRPSPAPSEPPPRVVLAVSPPPNTDRPRPLWPLIGALTGLTALAAAGTLWSRRRCCDHMPLPGSSTLVG